MTLLIGVGGGSGAGKTTSAKAIEEVIRESDGFNIERISLDGFYKDRSHLTWEETKKINYDHPQAWEWDLVIDKIKKLPRGEKTAIPDYDFSTRERKEGARVIENPPDIVLLEGIFAIYNKDLNDLLDIKIFVRAKEKKRFARRLKRDIEERGRTVEYVYSQFTETVKPMHDKFVQKTKENADYIIDGNKELSEMIDSAKKLGKKIICQLEENSDSKSRTQKAPVV